MRERIIHAGALLLAFGLSACTVNEADNRADFGTIQVPDDSCFDGCLKLADCDLCTADGICNPVDCADACRRNEDQASYLCLAQTLGCNQGDLDVCLDGSGVDVCQAACGRLEACERCLQDASEQCEDSYACVATCRSGGLPGAECLAALNTCRPEAITACLGDEEEDPGDDSCADACRVIDGCDQCLVGDDGECVSVADCARTCRADWPDEGACLNALEMCDAGAIGACLQSSIGDDDCAARCLFLDGCNLCLPDDAGACLSPGECAAGCREAGPDTYACLDELAACDEAPIIACLSGDEEPPPPDADTCQRACLALDGCDLCWPDDEGNCMAVEACADSCRALGDPSPANAGCLANLDSCEQADLDACFIDLPVVDCQAACLAQQQCGSEGDTGACIAACEADWLPGDLACYAAAADDCAAVALCPGFEDLEPSACDLACAGLASCDLSLDGPAACQAACAGYSEDQIACILTTGDDCPAMAACLAPEGPDCAATCARRLECDNPEDPDAFTADCLAACPQEPVADRQCVADAADCAAVLACAPRVPPIDCETVCGRQLECQDPAPEDPVAFSATCAARCDGLEQAERACFLEAADCAGVLACGAE